jgi:pyruvate kinase
VSDVANAIYDGTDAIMLSGETAYGDYPLEAVQTMSKIAQTVEGNMAKLRNHPIYDGPTPIRDYMAKAAISAVQTLPVKALVLDTLTGRSARTIATYRAELPVFAKAHDARVARELALSFGVYCRLSSPAQGQQRAGDQVSGKPLWKARTSNPTTW